MPYEVSQLLKELRDPVAAQPDEPIHEALDRMLDREFSQLPVKTNGRFYFITHESILMALHRFGSKIGESGLQVSDALVKVPTVYRATDDLFDLLAGMREMNAAVIVDDEQNLIHVVTSYDTTQYFRQWAEDIMQVRDIEYSLRRILNSGFKNTDGKIDESVRKVAVEEILSSNRDLRKKFDLGLRRYIAQASLNVATRDDWLDRAFAELVRPSVVAPGTGKPESESEQVELDQEPGTDLRSAAQILRERFGAAVYSYLNQQASADVNLDEASVEEAFKILYARNETIKEFADLTLGEYVKLFFKDACWPRCKDVIKLKEEEIRHMLEGVRDTRNRLAHFREEKVTAQERQQLRSCADWLSEREDLIVSAFEESAPLAEVEGQV